MMVEKIDVRGERIVVGVIVVRVEIIVVKVGVIVVRVERLARVEMAEMAG